jgi:uncharacterized membrane protein YjgN (DUF898 family)
MGNNVTMIGGGGERPQFGQRAGAAGQTASTTGFVYDGRLGELYKIFLLNLLLTIVTASIYRFWAKTKMRRYLWSHVSLEGDRFEYTGTGGELFVGFLIVMGFYLVVYFGFVAMTLSMDPGSPVLVVTQILLGLLLLYLVFVAQYAAQRYRLTRTLWRGIRGGMTGSAWIWGLKAAFFAFLSFITLTAAMPWTQMRLIDDRLNNSYFGDAKASIQSSSRPVYAAYFIGIAIMIVGLVLISAMLAGIQYLSGVYDEMMPIMLGGADQATKEEQLGELIRKYLPLFIGLGILFYISLILLGFVAFAQYYVAMAREIAAKLHMGSLRFATPVTIGRLIWRYVGNVLIIVFTLGLGLPIAIHRTMQFLTRNIEIVGKIEGSEITQANLPRPKFGEGLLEAFDPGII